ncbi:MAG: AAA family ATPase, partial [Actinobacteria bacterium]|nr:AAA family ATPase [Actinomycetota bacterium]
ILTPIEIKSAQTFNADFLKGLEYFEKLFSGRVETGYVVYDGEIEQKIRHFELVDFRQIALLTNNE